ncbi:MAG: porphobilinogen synthase [Candidatus Omnitrophica bacterium]|nr:porphobilinogen synthase [Candidatus Omnitrophota bacterium]
MAISLNKDNLVYPYFVVDGKNEKQVIRDFPGIFRLSIGSLIKDIEDAKRLGIGKVLLFGVPKHKDDSGMSAYDEKNIVVRAAREIKKEFPGLVVITDLCLCAYTAHGHCGILTEVRPRHSGPRSDLGQSIDRGRTLEALARIALAHAEAGADWVAPSAMAKKQVRVIRKALDKGGFKKTKILGYSAKFASNFYGPFRQAADSAPAFGDRSGYQLNFVSSGPALREIADDISEGADMVMVKPALGYLDIVNEARRKFDFPLAVYNVSGEYAFIKYGAKKKLWDEKKMVFEVLTSIKRAGADWIITYHAKDAAKWLS